MEYNDEVYIKIQIEKRKNSGNLTMNIHFNKEAPNFLMNSNEVNWYPTSNEIDFVNEAFEMISNHKKRIYVEPPEIYETEKTEEIQEKQDLFQKEDNFEKDNNESTQKDHEAVIDKILKRREFD